ncbi:putative L,D-transpeptidase YkuD [Maritalea myrionectae]|uniref:Putative L,D-transpeptidase YkuD n=1 Tax=Maritalea myrionectae TaxID=454601 RepID=A0A2R4MH01_9HYPH|nr:L,D-transpeptidase [Maritalea myrionectae]AVX05331.1 putative L,D-transpeptidase YkuD [Maritalea myrionectae]
MRISVLKQNIMTWGLALLLALLVGQSALAGNGLVKTQNSFGQTIYVSPPAGMTATTGTPRNGLQVKNKYGQHPKYLRQVVPYNSSEAKGTIIVDTGARYLYLVLGKGRAMRYGIGVAREGFEWSGTHRITAKREWPSWTPPAEMRKRQPELPAFMPGGINNPLGARALYIGSTLYRLHGTTHPSTIGRKVSSGCIRLTNDDIIDLYQRASIGAKVIVI